MIEGCLTLEDVLVHKVDVVDVECVIVHAEVLRELHVGVDVHEAGVTGLKRDRLKVFGAMGVFLDTGFGTCATFKRRGPAFICRY